MRFDMVRILPGQFNFSIGKNLKLEIEYSRMTLTQPFDIMIAPVTQSEWFGIMKTKPWSAFSEKDGVRSGPNHPAVGVSYEDAMAYAESLSRNTKCTYQLPTEVQWEYSARAGKAGRFFWGDKKEDFRAFSWAYDRDSCDRSECYLHEVCKLTPNDWGLYDMAGNVAEWVRDRCFLADDSPYIVEGHYPKEGTDFCHLDGNMAILRNGSFKSPVTTVAAYFKLGEDLSYANEETGFRLVREIS